MRRFFRNNCFWSSTSGDIPFVSRILDVVFRKIARLVAGWPKTIVLVGLILVGLVSLGLLRATISFDVKQQWISPNSRWIKYERDYESAFGSFFRHTDIIVTAKTNSTLVDRSAEFDDVIRRDILTEMLMLEQKIASIEARSTDQTVTRTAKLADLCLRPSPTGACFITSPLWHWRYNLSLIMSDAAIRTTLGRNGFSHPLGFKIAPTSIMGGARVLYQRASYAKLFKTTILFNNTAWAAQYLPDFDRQLKETVLRFSAQNATHSAFLSLDEDSIANSIAGALASDIIIIIIGFLVIFVFVAITLGPSIPLCENCGPPARSLSVQSKVGLGTYGFIIVGIAFLLVQSISALCGIVISAITLQVLPVLLLGVGIDSIYVLVRTFWNKIDGKPPGNRPELLPAVFEDTMCSIGPSMVMSTLSTSIIFVPVLTIDLPVISALAAQVIIATWLNFVLQVFLFAPVMILDAKRALSGRWDVLCCFKQSQSPTKVETNSSLTSSSDEASLEPLDDAPANSSDGIKSMSTKSSRKRPESREKSSKSPRLSESSSGLLKPNFIKIPNMVDNFVSVLFHNKISQAVGVLIFVAILILSIFGCLRATIGLEIATLIPDNSRESQAYKLLGENFNSSLPFFLVILAGEKGQEGCIDYADPNIPDALLALKRAVETSGAISETLSFWYGDFLSWLIYLSPHSGEYSANGNAVPPSKLLTWTRDFLNSVGSTHVMTLQQPAAVNSTRFPACVMMGSLVPLNGLKQIVEAIESIEVEISRFSVETELRCAKIVPYSPVFFALGQIDSFETDAKRVIAGSLVVVFFVTLLFINNILIAFIAVVVAGALCVSIIALHFPLGLQLNGITIINVALGLTLVTEYLCYFLRAYTQQTETIREKSNATPDVVPRPFSVCDLVPPASNIVFAFSTVGGMLILSIVSSVLGMIVLLFTGYKIIQVYFGAMWMCIILLAAIFSLGLFPLIMSLLSNCRQCQRVEQR